MKKIPLSQGKFAIVDDEDCEFLNQWKWYYHQGYAVRHVSYGPTILMHRVILERMGFKDFEDSDHINRNGIDNRRSNLRPSTHRQNLCNFGRRSNNTSGYIGVHWRKDCRKWRARINIDGKQMCLGFFTDIEDAVQARDKAAKKHHGEFAVLNIKE
jgi:hypothetical protein